MSIQNPMLRMRVTPALIRQHTMPPKWLVGRPIKSVLISRVNTGPMRLLPEMFHAKVSRQSL
jgi:hypothetical protein